MQVIYKQSKRERRKTKVAAYCRVSTNHSEQEDSYETQVSYYTSYIKSNPDWEFAGIYADKGISGTKAGIRPEFQRMVKDALDGKVDLILVKSISRFSRNVVDCQRYAELLHGNGVNIIFEKEGVNTADPSSFVIFGLMSSIAQSESESISQNMRWSTVKRQKKGEYKLGRILGYDLDGVPNEDAEIIRMIYQMFLDGASYTEIADKVGEYQRAQGKKGKLLKSEINYILHNEAYVGDKQLQKQPPKNFLTKKPDPTLSYESYFVSGGHQGIIDRSTWEEVEKKLQERQEAAVQFNPGRSHFLYGKIYCSECGSPYMRRNVGKHKTWVCRERFKGHGCKGRNIREDKLMDEIAKQMGWNEVTKEKAEAIDRVTIYPESIHVTRL